MRQRKERQLNRVGFAFFAVLSLLAAVTKLLIGFDIDEGYAIALPYRLLRGDRLFGDMWEIHQTSALLPALLMKPFVLLTGSASGIVLYMRAVAAVIHLGMTALFMYCLWQMLDKQNKYPVVLAGLLYLNMSPKWMMTVDFSMQQLWGMTLLLAALTLEEKYKKASVSFLTGLALSVTVLAYPAMVVLYPAMLVLYAKMDKGDEIKFRINKMLWFTTACLLAAALFLVWVLTRDGMNMESFLAGVQNLFGDGTHSMTKGDQLGLHLSRALNLGKQWAFFMAGAVALEGLLRVCMHLRAARRKEGEYTKPGEPEGLLAALLTVTSLLLICGEIVGIRMGPFHFQARFLLIYLLVWILSIRRLKVKEHALYYKLMILVTVSFAGILLLSNVGPDSSSSYLAMGMIAALVLLLQETGQKQTKVLFGIGVGVFLLSVIFCKGFYVRYTEYFPANILSERVRVQEGPLQGIWLLPQEAETEKSERQTVIEETKAGESCMIMGTDQILSLSAGGTVVTPSTISTPAYNRQWITYYTLYPGRLPQKVFIALNTVDDREKFFSQNEFGIWLSQRYDIRNRKENNVLCLIEKQ